MKQAGSKAHAERRRINASVTAQSKVGLVFGVLDILCE